MVRCSLDLRHASIPKRVRHRRITCPPLSACYVLDESLTQPTRVNYGNKILPTVRRSLCS